MVPLVLFGTLFLTVLQLAASAATAGRNGKIVVCNYEAKSHLRDGPAKFDVRDIEPALEYCTHLIYGYAAINEDTLKLTPINEQFDVIKDNYRKVTDLKVRYPNLKVLLSVGGNDDISGEGAEKNIKYRRVLESAATRLAFINSVYTICKGYGFDGLDFGWEFPETTKPKKTKTGLKKFWSSVKGVFKSDSPIDDKEQEHRSQFTALVRELKNTFKPDNLLVSVTVLPNVNSTVYYEPRDLAPHVDFVVLHAFDFYTPDRSPKLADFPSPLYELIDRRPDENIESWVKYWLSNGFPANKLVLGIPTYSRAWKLAEDAKTDIVPPEGLDGPGEPGPQTKNAGLLSYPEICHKVDGNQNWSPQEQPFKRVPDSTKRRGSYIYRMPNENGEGGIWIGAEDPESAANKATYVRNKGLGGIAIDDLTLDDFKGTCGHNKYAILRAAVSAL